MRRNRFIYAAITILIIGLGLGSRAFSSFLPDIVNAYLGDALWAAMIFTGCGFLFHTMKTITTGIISLSFCVIIECSQLYHAEWIDRIRDTSLGGLVLGYGFLWSDILAYTMGIVTCTLIELIHQNIKKRR
ncbi:ribosomal maturation YjgA family protein [Bacillus halotolerans]|uniref:ribosomal maturation YjgA family protein n=1 Tax=Bacillus halotolerans TaxID=260554 RepID=UPI000D06736D|nr:DUF2809 domain-containing protein [Bacillus halotolerans]PSA98764.1 DUF2809 domain-containing protein [Bacillus halotolerans]